MFYFNVPYSEKEEVKALGARWNPKVKKWYITSSKENYIKFAKWIMADVGRAIIATDYIYIIEGVNNCWKCGCPQTVVGIGVGKHYNLYEDSTGQVQIEPSWEFEEYGDEIHVGWSGDASDFPPKLFRYLTENYSVKYCYSYTRGDSAFANYCKECKSLQGNWYLFNEPGSPLSSCVSGNWLIERMKKIKIYGIPIRDDLQMDAFETGFCENDYAYLRYGQFEELILSDDPKDSRISYMELYSED